MSGAQQNSNNNNSNNNNNNFSFLSNYPPLPINNSSNNPHHKNNNSSSSSSSSSSNFLTSQPLSSQPPSTTTLPPLPTPSRPYHISRVVKPHAGLTACYHTALEAELGDDFPVVGGVAASADSFYSSQGRVTHKFGDFNAGLLEVVEAVVPGVASLEMETFTLLDLGRSAGDPSHPIAAAGAAMVVWNRNTKESIGKEDLVEMEVRGGRACLAALVGFGLGSA